MKKRIFTLLTIIITVVLCISLSACSQLSGKSAYEIACDNGFAGTEQEWLESLKGKDGQDSPAIDIYELYEAFLQENTGASFSDFLQELSVTGYNDTEYAAAIGIQSIVSIYSTFTKMVTTRPGQSSESEYMGAGSGVAYRKQSGYIYIITNYHVVYDRDSTTQDGIAKTIEAYTYGFETSGKGVTTEFVGGSITKDIAVIKAPASAFSSNIQVAAIGDSNLLSLGEKVVAIGNPGAEGISVSAGVVSVDSEEIKLEALNLASKSISVRVIRTDTAINSGNSGGGLFNAKGELIGIVNAKIIETGIENIGYAIPSSVASGIADCVIDNDSKKCILGVTTTVLSTQTQYNAAKNRVDIIETVSVVSIEWDMLASGKLSQDDKLISVRINDGQTLSITRLFHLSDYLYRVRLGDTIYLSVEHSGGGTSEVEMTPTAENFSLI